MNNYELLYIINNDLADEAKEALIAKLNGVVTENGGSVESVEKWGTKKLAYPINFKNEGYYVLVNFAAEATLPSELERIMRINDDVVRFMVVKK
ncbi:MAG: 30S ribosomal protein S6 [Clostridia bacterium]|nr:30S ribosomal protein S6 [Clostridia bacterium]